MRFFKIIFAVGIGCVLTAQAAYQAEIIFKNGAERTIEDLVVQSGKVVLAEEDLSIPFGQIQQVVFTFENPLDVDDCEGYVQRGDWQGLLSRINEFLAPVQQGLDLPGNLDVYIQYQMRAGFWTKQFDVMEHAARVLERKNSSYAPSVGLYRILVMLEQDRPHDEVAAAFSAIENPEKISAPFTEFIRGRLAMTRREYKTALQHFSKILVYYSRDPEWVPAATWYEASVYKRTGYLESAAHIVEEFKIAYPDGYWSARAEELK